MLFSIVIPVYNVETYLDECLCSILSQAKQFKEECEVLLIDDGSTDRSGKICDEYLKKYPDIIRVFHNANHGLLWTRRFGFKLVQGDYVINCDSDDLLEDEALEKLYYIVKKYEYPDVVIYNYNSYDGKNKTSAFNDIFTNELDCVVEKEAVLKEYLSRHSIVSVCGKMVKRTCIDVNRDYKKFGRISTGEDTLQSIEFFSNSQTFVYLNQVVYDYRCGSGMTGKFDKNYYFTFKRIFEEIEVQKGNWNLADFDKLFAVKVLQTAGRAITQSRYKKWESMREWIGYLKQIREDDMLQKNISELTTVKRKLQKDHTMLLKLLQNRMYILICMMLSVKNFLEGNSKDKKIMITMENIKSIYFVDNKSYLKACVLREHEYYIYKFQKYLRGEEIAKTVFLKLYYRIRRNILGRKLGFTIPPDVFAEGLHIWHYGNIVVNRGARVGKNCVLHGDNCIGNNGKDNGCPIIGDNVDIGVGAKIIGNVHIANNVKIGAGAVVIKSCEEPGAVLVGIPACTKKGNNNE